MPITHLHMINTRVLLTIATHGIPRAVPEGLDIPDGFVYLCPYTHILAVLEEYQETAGLSVSNNTIYQMRYTALCKLRENGDISFDSKKSKGKPLYIAKRHAAKSTNDSKESVPTPLTEVTTVVPQPVSPLEKTATTLASSLRQIYQADISRQEGVVLGSLKTLRDALADTLAEIDALLLQHETYRTLDKRLTDLGS